MIHLLTLNYDIIDTSLIYEQMCKLTSFVKHLRPRFVNYLREYLCVYERVKIQRLGFCRNTCSTETLIVKYVSLVI